MPIYSVEYICSDTSGNSWAGDEPIQYIDATSIYRVYADVGQNRDICSYRINGKTVERSRTPPGKGYGNWENNPAFNLSESRNATQLSVSIGLGRLVITELPVRVLIG